MARLGGEARGPVRREVKQRETTPRSGEFNKPVSMPSRGNHSTQQAAGNLPQRGPPAPETRRHLPPCSSYNHPGQHQRAQQLGPARGRSVLVIELRCGGGMATNLPKKVEEGEHWAAGPAWLPGTLPLPPSPPAANCRCESGLHAS